MNESLLFQDEDEPQMRQVVRIVMPFNKLRPNFVAYFHIPDDLTMVEVDRIEAMLRTIPLTSTERQMN